MTCYYFKVYISQCIVGMSHRHAYIKEGCRYQVTYGILQYVPTAISLKKHMTCYYYKVYISWCTVGVSHGHAYIKVV